jgi:2-oxoisovalerate dehydrogenase E1 component
VTTPPTSKAEGIDRAFVERVGAIDGAAPRDDDALEHGGLTLTREDALRLFDAQLGSRHLDLIARTLRSKGRGFYTIGSSGHEGNAAVAAALRHTDPALLHYRSGGFFLARAQEITSVQGIRDVLLGMLAAKNEPIAGGRHKVFGSVPLNVLPQTSTIASHLPRAVGLALAIERARKLGVACPYLSRRGVAEPRDALFLA